jgi:hypothetical protein
MNFEIEVMNVSDEEDVQIFQMFSNLERLILVFGDDMQMLELPHLLILIALELRHASYLMCKENLIRNYRRKKGGCL